MNPTLQDAKDKVLKERNLIAAKETEKLCESFNATFTTPEIQLDMFEQVFAEPFKEFIKTGVDVYNKTNPKQSIVNMWSMVSGSLNSPVDVVYGEGPNRVIVATLPSYLPNQNLIKNNESIEKHLNMSIGQQGSNPDAYNKIMKTALEKAKSKLNDPEIKKQHQEKWIKTIDLIKERSDYIKNKNKKQPNEEENKSENKIKEDDGSTFEW